MNYRGKILPWGIVLLSLAGVFCVFQFDWDGRMRLRSERTIAVLHRLEALSTPTYSSRNHNLSILMEIADDIYAESNEVERQSMLEGYVDALVRAEFDHELMLSTPSAAIGSYHDLLDCAVIDLIADSFGNGGRRRMRKIDYSYPFAILIEGWSRLNEVYGRLDEIVGARGAANSGLAAGGTNGTGAGRGAAVDRARERVGAEIRRCLDKVERRLERDLLGPGSKALYSGDGYGAAVRRFTEVVGRAPRSE